MTASHTAAHPGVSATVMASAGTGKTWLLVTRLIRLLLAGARPEGILAITFTRKAAAEMQTRLGERLFALAAADTPELEHALVAMDVTPDAPTCHRARRLYESHLHAPQQVRTTTFHAFCQEVLRRFPLEADVPPGFELVERTGELATAAWHALIAEATAAPDGTLAADLEHLLSTCGGLAGMETALYALLRQRGDWWAFTEPADAPAADWAARRLAEELAVDPVDGTDPREDFFAHAGEPLGEYARLLARHPTKTHLAQAEQAAAALDPNVDLGTRFAHAQVPLLTSQGAPRVRKASAAQEAKMGPAGQARFLELHDRLCERLLAVREALARRQTWTATTAWYRAGSRLIDHFQRLKAEQRLLDFADLEWRAYRLLTARDNAHWVQYKLDQRIDHLLVDEFQDTNPTQWRLLLPLLEEMAAGAPERERSVFLVGDVKQSIYRFRRADPQLLGAAHTWLRDAVAAQAHTLQTSWRSAPAVITLVNRLFGGDGPLAGVLADFAPHSTHHQQLWGRIELLPLVGAGESPPETEGLRDPLSRPRPDGTDDRYRREGRLIAARIGELMAAGTAIGPPGEARPLRYGDILILVRSRTHSGDYETALRAAGIPYVGAERGTLLERLEVRDLVALLEILIAPHNPLALASVLRSPLFACSDADLERLADSQGDWFNRLHRAAETAPTSVPLTRAWRLLSRWRGLAGHIPIHDLLDRVYSEGGVLARYEAAFPEHLRARMRSNLTRFLELALEIDAGRYPSLSRFLDRLAQLRESAQEAPDEAPSAGGDRVRLMTIHAAKGLEAPVVFLADAAGTPRNDRPYRALVDWPTGADRPRNLLLVGRSAERDEFTRSSLEREARAEAREQANLLYVAVTRARQLLICTGSQPRRGSELGWFGALVTALGDGAPIGHPLVWEEGMPPPASNAPDRRATPSPPLPPGLERPPVPPAAVELAPSTGTGQHLPGQTDDEDDEDALLRGVVIHRLLERLALGTVRATCRTAVAAEYGLAPDDPAFAGWWEEACRAVDTPELAVLFRPPVGTQAWCEVPVSFRRSDGIVVHGIIDRLLVGPETVWVVDYKTHRRAADADLTVLTERYATQLTWYGTAVQRLWPGRPVRASLLFTAIPAIRDVPFENLDSAPTSKSEPSPT